MYVLLGGPRGSLRQEKTEETKQFVLHERCAPARNWTTGLGYATKEVKVPGSLGNVMWRGREGPVLPTINSGRALCESKATFAFGD